MARARKKAGKAKAKPKIIPRRDVICLFCGRTEKDEGVDMVLWRCNADGTETRRIAICSRCVYQAISILNDDLEHYGREVYVSKSRRHGRGLFAGENIKKGAYVGTYVGPDDAVETDTNFPYIIWCYDEETEEDLGNRLGTNEFRFVNHSEDANLELWGWHFYAAKNIKKDEELTWFYSKDFDEGLKKTTRKAKGKGNGKPSRRRK